MHNFKSSFFISHSHNPILLRIASLKQISIMYPICNLLEELLNCRFGGVLLYYFNCHRFYPCCLKTVVQYDIYKEMLPGATALIDVISPTIFLHYYLSYNYQQPFRVLFFWLFFYKFKEKYEQIHRTLKTTNKLFYLIIYFYITIFQG